MKPVKALWKSLLSAKYYTDEERRNGEPLHLRFPWSPLDDSGQYGELAEYLVKETDKSRKLRGKYCRRFSCTKNIVRPQPKVEIISAAEWRRRRGRATISIVTRVFRASVNIRGCRYRRQSMFRSRERAERWWKNEGH